MGSAVALDIRDATDESAAPVYPEHAALGRDGTFVGKLDVPDLSGSYILSARACHGDGRGCAVVETPFTVE